MLSRLDAICQVLEDTAPGMEDGALTEGHDVIHVGSVAADGDVKGDRAEVAMEKAKSWAGSTIAASLQSMMPVTVRRRPARLVGLPPEANDQLAVARSPEGAPSRSVSPRAAVR